MKNGPVGRNWDGKVWIPPFGFDDMAQPVSYRMFPREAWAFADYSVRNGFNPVRVDFPEGGGRWFGIHCKLTTVYDCVLVGEISRSWIVGTGLVPPEAQNVPDAGIQICYPGLFQSWGAPELIEWAFHKGRAFSFYKTTATTKTTWIKISPLEGFAPLT